MAGVNPDRRRIQYWRDECARLEELVAKKDRKIARVERDNRRLARMIKDRA